MLFVALGNDVISQLAEVGLHLAAGIPVPETLGFILGSVLLGEMKPAEIFFKSFNLVTHFIKALGRIVTGREKFISDRLSDVYRSLVEFLSSLLGHLVFVAIFLFNLSTKYMIF